MHKHILLSVSMLLSFFLACEQSSKNEDTAKEERIVCASLSVTECSTEEACQVIMGSEISWGEDCISFSESTGITCFDASVTCDPVPVFVEGDPTNTMYRLESNCIPEGWYETTFEFTEECE